MTSKSIKTFTELHKKNIIKEIYNFKTTKKYFSGNELAETLMNYAKKNNYDMDKTLELVKPFIPIRRTALKYKPISSSWYHDKQYDDVLTESHIELQKLFLELRAIVSPEQRTPQWYSMRNDKITASDGACALGDNKYEEEYKFIIKKIDVPPFTGNSNTHHGKKYEQIATMIYEHRMNVIVDEFGLLAHPVHTYLGASPDGIIGLYKKDGKHLTEYVGRMLEIKCPVSRNIIQDEDGEMFDICPKYYWIQVQLQLECCNLDDCDFWQCSLYEYPEYDDYFEDTHETERFRSKTNDLEKGCLIQLYPKDKKNPKLFDDASYLYPPHVEMSPDECLEWIEEMKIKIDAEDKYVIDQIMWWRLEKSNCTLIKRDKEWFAKSLPKLKKIWDYVLYFRNNKSRKQLLMEYIESMPRKYNKTIMATVDILYNNPDDNSPEVIKIKNQILSNKQTSALKIAQSQYEETTPYATKSSVPQYMFDDDVKVLPIKPMPSNGKSNKINNASPAYMFDDDVEVLPIKPMPSNGKSNYKTNKINKTSEPVKYMFDD